MCERGTPRAPGMSKMQQNTETEKQQSATGRFFSSITQQSGGLKLRYQIPSKCTCIQTTRFGQQQRTTVDIYHTKCVCWVYLIKSISRESGKLQTSRHVLATRRCCHAIDTPESIVVVPTLENHLHVSSIFSGKDSRLRLGFMLHPRALCKLEKKQ